MGRLRALPSRLAPLPALIKSAPKQADAFYESPAWRRLVATIKRKRGPHCEECGSANRVAGDHVVEIKDGGAPLDEDNVVLRCGRCHNRKTAAERARRAREGIR